MAILQLDRVWVNRLDTGEAVSAISGRNRPQNHGLAGEVRTYAGGRQRAISVAGERSQFEVTLRLVSLATITLLRTWKGIPVQVRDHRGQLFVGVFFDVRVLEHASPTEYDVALPVRVVTTVEGV